MQKKFLVSFCNNKKQIKDNYGYLGILTCNSATKNIDFKPVSISLPKNISGNGVTGMCILGDQLVILLQDSPSVLVYLDRNLNYITYKVLEGLSGVHTIVSKQDEIYLSVTSQDRVVKLDKGNQLIDVWNNNTNKDSIHLNSLCWFENALFATAFGVKSSNLWSSAQSGYIFNTSNESIIQTHIWHPHSLFLFKNALYCCDSTNQRVIDQDGKILLGDLPGYARGLYMDDELIICGSSFGRKVSHSTGIKISNKSDSGAIAGSCGINIYDKKSNHIQFINLGQQATEIFEVIKIN